MKTVIEMAREAGIDDDESHWLYWKAMERFAELVRADEREKYKWDVHSCGPTCKRYACVAMREAVEAEREACAKVCESLWRIDGQFTADEFAAEVRARGNT
jgi:hypothetical protein